MTRPGVAIPADRLAAHVGRKVHVEGWPFGCQFVLLSVGGGYSWIRTPTTGREYCVPSNRLLYLRKSEPAPR